MNTIQGNAHDEINIVPESEDYSSPKAQAYRDLINDVKRFYIEQEKQHHDDPV